MDEVMNYELTMEMEGGQVVIVIGEMIKDYRCAIACQMLFFYDDSNSLLRIEGDIINRQPKRLGLTVFVVHASTISVNSLQCLCAIMQPKRAALVPILLLLSRKESPQIELPSVLTKNYTALSTAPDRAVGQ